MLTFPFVSLSKTPHVFRKNIVDFKNPLGWVFYKEDKTDRRLCLPSILTSLSQEFYPLSFIPLFLNIINSFVLSLLVTICFALKFHLTHASYVFSLIIIIFHSQPRLFSLSLMDYTLGLFTCNNKSNLRTALSRTLSIPLSFSLCLVCILVYTIHFKKCTLLFRNDC